MAKNYPGTPGSSGTPGPASPSPGRSKRPQATQATHTDVKKKFKFEELTIHVLFPNGTSGKLSLDVSKTNSVEALLKSIKEHPQEEEDTYRNVEWSGDVWLEDHKGNRLTTEALRRAVASIDSSGTLLVLLQDGHPNSFHSDKDMWNVTPKPEMLGQLPQGYTLETALADQVDNALQAVWHNEEGCRRLVSVNLGPDRITIFDTGQGMDGSTENCIANWGTVGGSTHRAVHHMALGGEPPFLKPYLGKYGAGGVAAALHLGSSVTVWSKTKQSMKVVSLVLEQKALVDKHRQDPQQRVWRTAGEFRDASKKEKELAPHGSFTRVEISKLKSQYCIVGESNQQYWKVDPVRQLLKDIYFPYIQSEAGSSSKTICPVEFEVNGMNLLEVINCETAISRLHTCTGRPFVFDIRLTKAVDERDREGGKFTWLKTEALLEANARVTCQYYPNRKGKEALETVLEELSKLRPGNSLTFETLHRVTIRWLGRLLPEVKWRILPFMKVLPKKEQKLGVSRLWAKRVRAFVDTDAGFHPNQSKTELERDQPFVVALKQTGSEDFIANSASGVTVSIRYKDRDLTSAQLISGYMEWLKYMHLNFDEEFVFIDEGTYIFNHPTAPKDLGMEHKPFIVFHKHMKDSNGEWKVDHECPIRIKLCKGTNGLKSDMYATVEYFFHDGAEEQGEVKFLC